MKNLHKLSRDFEEKEEFRRYDKSELKKVQVIRREDIPSLYSVNLQGKTYYLGILKDFHKHSVLGKFIPEQSRLSMSWVHLGRGEILQPHVHPIRSMIIICKGELQTLGELTVSMYEGDILIVPPYHEHGFIGCGDQGFWGISVQFEGLGLYEDPHKPLVEFRKFLKNSGGEEGDNTLSSLLKHNELERQRLSKNPLFSFLQSKSPQDKESIEKFLDYFQVWSDAFQKMVLNREVFCDNPLFKKFASQHLEEEFGHNKKLAQGRKKIVVRWDPILHAVANWFPWKILTLDELEKIVLISLVVEASATVFYNEIPSFIGRFVESSHFEEHKELDVLHETMGLSLLEGLTASQYERLRNVQVEGWEMLNQLYQRIYELLSLNE